MSQVTFPATHRRPPDVFVLLRAAKTGCFWLIRGWPLQSTYSVHHTLYCGCLPHMHHLPIPQATILSVAAHQLPHLPLLARCCPPRSRYCVRCTTGEPGALGTKAPEHAFGMSRWLPRLICPLPARCMLSMGALDEETLASSERRLANAVSYLSSLVSPLISAHGRMCVRVSCR
jgi:hypothetical protein